MSRTPWSRSSSLLSDRIPPRTPTTGTTGRNKGKGKTNEPSKSKEVLKLESLVEGLRTWTTGADPKGGCFCLAQEHGLSKYTPICVQCGLILCSLHDAFYPCPHCASPLTSPTSREALIERLTSEISEALAREAEQRERERQEQEKAAGAFPALTSSSTDHQPEKAKFAPRKVLSLNPQTRTVTVTSYKPTHPARGPSAAEVKKETVFRVPPPPKEVDYVRKKPMEGRRWQNLRDDSMAYVPPPAQSTTEASRSDPRKKKRGS